MFWVYSDLLIYIQIQMYVLFLLRMADWLDRSKWVDATFIYKSDNGANRLNQLKGEQVQKSSIYNIILKKE